MKTILVIALAATLALAPVQATPKARRKPATPATPFNAQTARRQLAQMKAETAQMQALVGQSTQEQKRAQARARLQAQVRKRRLELLRIESGSKEA